MILYHWKPRKQHIWVFGITYPITSCSHYPCLRTLLCWYVRLKGSFSYTIVWLISGLSFWPSGRRLSFVLLPARLSGTAFACQWMTMALPLTPSSAPQSQMKDFSLSPAHDSSCSCRLMGEFSFKMSVAELWFLSQAGFNYPMSDVVQQKENSAAQKLTDKMQTVRRTETEQ